MEERLPGFKHMRRKNSIVPVVSGMSKKIKIIDKVTGLVTYYDNIADIPAIGGKPVEIVAPVVNTAKYDKKGLKVKDFDREIGDIEKNEILIETANGISLFSICKNMNLPQDKVGKIINDNPDEIVKLRNSIKDLSLRSLEERIKRMDKIEFMMFNAITENKINDERASFLVNSIKTIEQARAIASGSPQDSFDDSVIPKTKDDLKKFVLNISINNDKIEHKEVVVDAEIPNK